MVRKIVADALPPPPPFSFKFPPLLFLLPSYIMLELYIYTIQSMTDKIIGIMSVKLFVCICERIRQAGRLYP